MKEKLFEAGFLTYFDRKEKTKVCSKKKKLKSKLKLWVILFHSSFH